MPWQVAKAKGHLRGKQPKLSNTQRRHLLELHAAGMHSTAELADTVSELLDESWVVRADTHPMIDVIVRAPNSVGFQPKVEYEANDYQ